MLKECLISKDLQTIREKNNTDLLSVYSSCTAENFKAIHCKVFGVWSLPSTTKSNHLKNKATISQA